MGLYNIYGEYLAGRKYQFFQGDIKTTIDLDQKEFQGPGGLLLSSLGACKLASFLELKDKYKIRAEEVHLKISGETGFDGLVESTRQPISRFLKIKLFWEIKTNHSEEEIREFMKKVDGACTIGNSLNKDIEISTHIEIR